VNSPKRIPTEASRRNAGAATPIRDIKRKQIKAWIARDEVAMTSFRAAPRKTKR